MCVCLLVDVRVRRRSLVSSEPCLPINSTLCCPRSLRKMKSVYHCDWHRIVSPFFFLTRTHTRHLHALPLQPSPPLHHSDTHTHTPLQAQTASDSVAAATASACRLPFAVVCMAFGCHTSTQSVPHFCSGCRRGILTRPCGICM